MSNNRGSTNPFKAARNLCAQFSALEQEERNTKTEDDDDAFLTGGSKSSDSITPQKGIFSEVASPVPLGGVDETAKVLFASPVTSATVTDLGILSPMAKHEDDQLKIQINNSTDGLPNADDATTTITTTTNNLRHRCWPW
eukprot:GEZU01040213.1.p1 GENE.GEZU01040213.1~~GEZU01040213.1.p1  ORF type:complete len:140 (-),score=34.62 GEZU01040213.1:150-569(-)